MVDRSDRIAAILCAAVELATPDERADYIRLQCGNDDELRSSVEELLAAHFRAGAFLEHPASTLIAPVDAEVTERSGTTIDRYKLLEQIGEGGFATVFMAEQERPVRRRVAVKVIKAGMDTRQIIARLEAERQALAMMDHPNIAKVFDGGATETGRPYFVMELVKGAPITDYCDENRLSFDARLDLFLQVCRAVEHAHQKGIIHRDLKPSNVLVSTQDGRPSVKVIDFGIAKATESRLTDKTLFTDFRQLIGTPSYMSPEQADGSLDVDTRSDVYSLGVLLYEMLSGAPPFDPRDLRSKAIAEMQRIIREVEPQTPSARLSTLDVETRMVKASERQLDPKRLVERVRGELDWIVMRSLEKDRGRRYQSAAALADDVQRYLSNEPIEARPASRGYRFRKFARRNKGVLFAFGLIGATLTAATVVSTWQAIRASRAKRQAVADAHRAEAISDFLVKSFRSTDPDQDGRTVTIVEVLERTTNELEGKYADEPIVKATLLHTLGQTQSSLGIPEKAVPLLEEALKLRTSHLGEQHAETLSTMAALVGSYSRSKRHDEAVVLGEKYLQLQQASFDEGSIETAKAMRLLSSVYRQCRRAKESVPLAAAALKIYQAKFGPEHEESLDMMLEQLAAIGQATGEGNVVSVPYSFRDILKIAVPHLGEDHTLCLSIRDSVGYSALHRGQYDFASEVFTALLGRWMEKLGPESLETRRTVALLVQVSTKHVDPRKGMRDLAVAAEVAPNDPQVEAARKQVEARMASPEEMADKYVANIKEAKDGPWATSPRKSLCCKLAQMPDVFDLAAPRLSDETALWIGRGQDRIWRDQLLEAEADYAKVIHQRPLQDEHYEYGCLLLLRGDTAAYQEFCQQQFDRAGEPRDEYAAYVAARLYAMGPAKCVSTTQLVEWAELAASKREPWQIQALALAYLRAGRFDEAIAAYKKGIVNEAARYDSAENWYGLAIAYHRQGNLEKAKHAIEQARMSFRDAAPPRAGERAYVPIPSSWLLMRWYSLEAEKLFSHEGLKSAESVENVDHSATH